MFGKLLGLASLGEVFAGFNLTKKFISGLVIVMALTIVASIVAGSLVILGLYECHELFLHHGVEADMAVLYTGLVGIAFLLAILGMIGYRVKQMQKIPFSISRAEMAGTSALAILRGFYKGLMEHKKHSS